MTCNQSSRIALASALTCIPQCHALFADFMQAMAASHLARESHFPPARRAMPTLSASFADAGARAEPVTAISRSRLQ